LAGLAVKRYPLRVVSENPNPPVADQSVPISEQAGQARPNEGRARLHKLLAKQLRNFTILFARTLAEEDADTVHDLRVCTRRLQQILTALVPEKNLSKARSVRRTLRRVRRALGSWRNCDVALQWVVRHERRASKPARKSGWRLVRESIAAERQEAIEGARRKLYKADGVTLAHRVQQLLALGQDRLGGADPHAVVRTAVADAAAQWRQALERAQADRSVQNIHALRIRTKRLRYWVELARDLGCSQVSALIGWFKLMQDRLGRWHDRQELGRFITRALANSDVLIAQPAVAVELLREVEKDLKISSREVEELFRLATQSEGARQLQRWLQSYCAASARETAAPAGDGATPIEPPPSASTQSTAGPQTSQQPQSSDEADEEVRN